MFRLVAVLSRTVFALGALSLSIGIARAATVAGISNPTPVSFGSQPVGSAQAQTTVTFTVTVGGTLPGTPLVLTTGQPNLDFTLGTGSTCTGSVSAGTCTVKVIFTPRAPGQRLGAVVLQAGGSTVATALLYGTGTGPGVVFPGNTAINTLGGSFNLPRGVAVDGVGNVYVADFGNNVVKEIVAVGGSIPASNPTINTLGPSGSFSGPSDVAIDGAGNVYVADQSHNAVKEIVAVGGIIPASNPTINTLGPSGTFNKPGGVAVDGAGNVYVADSFNNAVKEIVAVGGGIPASNPTINTLGPSGTFSQPLGVAVDGAGNVYVADSLHSAVKEIVAVGGSIPASNPTINTLGPSGTFSQPQGVTVDGAGNVYVADTANNAVKEIVAVGGSIPASNPTINLLGLSTSFSAPTNVAVDGAGNVYVADLSNNAVKEILLATSPSLTFASTSVGNSTATQTLTLQNIGNTSLTFPIPTSGTNPALSSNYTLSSGGSTACPQLTTSSSAQTLAPGTCTAVLSFTPVKASTAAGSLVFTDNSNNVTNATQTVTLTGTATAATGTTAQTITFPQPTTPAQAGTAATLTASSTSGLAIVYSVVSGPATLSGANGNVVTYTGGGTVVLEADQYGNNTYSAATAVQRTVTVQTGVGAAGPTQTATVTITTAGTPSTISVVTQGVTGLDFAFGSGGTCSTSTAYTVGQTCTVNYTFTPNATGPRYGAAVLSSGATVLGTSYLSGIGTGPVAGFTQSSFSGAADGVAGNVQFPALVLGGTSPNPTGNGNVLYIPNNSNVLYKDTVGTGTTTFYGGAGTARYRGAAVDGAGNVYVSDVTNNNVVKLSSSGTLLATWPVSGVSLNTPYGMVFGTDGTLYVANPGAYDIVAITPAGVASVLPVSGYSFTAYSLGIDGSNNLYIPDNANSRILKVPGNSGAGGAATLVSVTGTAISAPSGVAIDSAGELYVTGANSTVLRISAAGVSAAVPETGLNSPAGVVTDNRGHVYVTDAAASSPLFTLTLASPPALSFGSVAVGSASTAQAVTVLNSGNASLSLASVTASTANFTGALGTCGATLASGISCAPSFAFTPQSATALTGNGIVTDNSLNASGSTQTVALSGTGTPGTVTFGTMNFSPAATEPQGTSQIISISEAITYGGVQPTGAVTFVLNGVTYTATCTTAGSPETCTATVPAATIAALAVASYTVTAALAQDSTYNAGTGTSGTFSITTPLVITAPSNIIAEATYAAGAVVTYTATANDGYDGTIIPSCAPASGATFALGTTQVTCTATDSHSNHASKSFTVTVQDTTAPTITTPSNKTVEATGAAGAVATYSATATDAVDGTDSVTCAPMSGSTFALGTTQVTCSSTDSHNNKATSSFTVTVQDTTAPTITLPSNKTVEATGAAGAVATYSATATDAVDGTDSVTCAPMSGSTFALGTTQVTCSSTDSHNNKATASFTVTVQDTTAPVITTPSNQTVEATSPAGAVVTYSATATDAVDGTDSVSCVPVSGSTFAIGTTQVTCSSTDSHGNKATKSFTVTVRDTTPPVITVPSNISAEATGAAGAVVTFTATAADAVDGTEAVTCVPASGSTFALGTTQVTCSSTDAHGNRATASFTVTVVGPAVTSISPTFGPFAGGTTVTISGSGFTGVTGVRFGGVAATGVVFNSDSSITATSPALAGTNAVVDVTVTTGAGTTATSSADQFTYIVPASFTLPSTAVGVSSGTQTAYVTFMTVGTLGTINVLTQGAVNKDYVFVSGGSCATGTAYTVGQVCTVNYTFTPSRPGQRLGAVSLTNSTNTIVLGTSFLIGTGTGPLATFPGSTAISSPGSTSGNFSNPHGMAVDGAGDVFVADPNNNAVKEIVAVNGVVTSSSTVNTVGSGFANPAGVAVDGAGDVFVADIGNNAVKEIVAVNGVVTSSSTVNTVGSGFNVPTGMAVDGAGNVYVADYGHSAVKEIVAVNGVVTSSSTVNTVGSGFNNPFGVAVDGSGDVFVADEGNSAVKEIVAVNGVVTSSSTVNTVGGGFGSTFGVAVDGSGHVFVADAGHSAVKEVDLTAAPSLAFATTSAGTTSSDSPQSVTLQNEGNAPLTFASVATGTANFTVSGAGTCSTGTPLPESGVCKVAASFTPMQAGPLMDTLTLTDNSLNVSGSTQTVALSGTGTIGTKTITFPQPTTPVVAGTSATLTASTSNGDPVVFTITAGTATISGTTTTSGTTTATIVYTNSGSVTIAANSAASANYAAAATVSHTVTVTAAPASSTAPNTAVGTTSATQTAEVTFTTAGTPGTISVLTQGASGLDFAFVNGGTCSTSTAYTIGQSCTVQYTFTPNATGPRYGAVVLSAGATALGTSYLGGVGTGPVAGFTQSSFSGAADGVGGNVQYPALVLGGTSPNPTGNGNVLYIPNNSNVLSTYTIGAGLTTFYGGAGTARYRGAAVDGAGNVYVSDNTSNNVFKLSSSGTLLATWPVSGVSLSSPWGMVFGTDGTLYVANPGANDIVAITPAGVASVLAVSGYSFTAYSLGIDGSNNLYIPDNANSRILKVPGNSGAGGAAALVSVTGTAISAPGGVAIDSAGELYVTEGNSTVLRISAAGVSAAVPQTGLSSPAGVVTDNRGHVYVTDAAVASLFTLTLASPPALSFGSVAVGSGSAAQTVTLLNSGNASLSIASVIAPTIMFTGSAGSCSASLLAGSTCSPSFSFTPRATGPQTANGIITDNSLNVSGSTQTVALSGTGTPPPTITSYTPNPVPTGGNITVTATGTSLSGTTGVCIFQTSGYLLDCDSTSNVTATSFTFVTSPSIGAGTYCLRVGNSTGNPCITYTISSTPSTFGSLAVTGYASPAVITEGGTVTVTAYYTNGSVDTLFTGTVTLTSSDAKATLPSSYTFTSADAGVHVFNVTLNSPGTESITATSGSVTGSQTGILVGDAIWVLNAAGTLDKLSRTGSQLTSGVGSSGTASSFGGVAFDSAGDVFSVSAGANALAFASYAGGGATTYTGGGLNAPVSVAVDGAGYIWIANSGNNTVSEFTNGRAAMSPSAGYGTSAGLNAPSSVSIDPTGGVWIANRNGNSVTHIFGAATPVATPLAAATVPQ